MTNNADFSQVKAFFSHKALTHNENTILSCLDKCNGADYSLRFNPMGYNKVPLLQVTVQNLPKMSSFIDSVRALNCGNDEQYFIPSYYFPHMDININY